MRWKLDWANFLRVLGLLLGTVKKKIGQWLTKVFSVVIPEVFAKVNLPQVPSFFFLSGKWEKASQGECDFSRTVFGFEMSLDFFNTLKSAYPCCFFHNIVPSLVWKWHVLLNQSLHDNWILNLKNGNKCSVPYFLSVNKSKWQAPSNIPCEQ